MTLQTDKPIFHLSKNGLISKITLIVLTHLADKLELCLRDYEQGGFLSPEKRGIALTRQTQAAHLARVAAQINALEQYPHLRNRLLLYAQVLNNEYPNLSQVQLSTKNIRTG